MFDTKILDLKNELIVGRHTNQQITLTEAYSNLYGGGYSPINIDFWTLKVFMGLWTGGMKLFIRSFRNRHLYKKLKNRECDVRDVLHVFLDCDDAGVSDTMKRFVGDTDTLDLNERHQVYLDMLQHIHDNYGNIQIC